MIEADQKLEFRIQRGLITFYVEEKQIIIGYSSLQSLTTTPEGLCILFTDPRLDLFVPKEYKCIDYLKLQLIKILEVKDWK